MEGVDAPSYMDSVASWHPATRAVEAAIMHVRGVTSSQGGVSARMLSGNELVPTTGYRGTKSSSVLHTLLCSRVRANCLPGLVCMERIETSAGVASLAGSALGRVGVGAKMARFRAPGIAVVMLAVSVTGADAAHTAGVPPRPRRNSDVVLNVGGFMLRASASSPGSREPARGAANAHKPLRLRGGGNAHGALPKYPSNRALKQDEYAAPFGTIMRTRSGAMIGMLFSSITTYIFACVRVHAKL